MSPVGRWRVSHRVHLPRGPRPGVGTRVLGHVVRRPCNVRGVLMGCASGGWQRHVVSVIGTGVDSPGVDHELLSSRIPHVSLLALVFVVGKLDNEGSGRSLHDHVVVEVFDGLYRRVTVDISQKGGALAGSIGVANHVDFPDVTIRLKELADLFFPGPSREHPDEQLVFGDRGFGRLDLCRSAGTGKYVLSVKGFLCLLGVASVPVGDKGASPV
mmetsp:Transcript_3750/g.10646  ORF Transcript_3750/g.10646 Transcript_3750/m.10646 type:complete len:214 (-) Transcript_3750:667-1308(-)